MAKQLPQCRDTVVLETGTSDLTDTAALRQLCIVKGHICKLLLLAFSSQKGHSGGLLDSWPSAKDTTVLILYLSHVSSRHITAY